MREPGRALTASLLVGLVAAAAVLAVLLSHGEAASWRAGLLGLVACFGGLLAALPVILAAGWIAGGWPAWLRAGLGGAFAGLLFIPATLFCFAVQIRVIDGRLEGDLMGEIASGDLVFSMMGAMGMFTPTGLRYLAPWPAAAVALAAAAILRRPPRRPSGA